MVEINKNTVTKIFHTLEPMLEQMMTSMKVPSLNLVVTNRTEILFAESYGFKDLEKKTLPTLDTIYMIGSCTKTYTALAIMQLVEQGKINLNSPIKNYIPITLGSAKNPITVRHLLTHSSGLPDLGMAKLLIERIKGESSSTVPYTSWNDFYSFTNGAQNELEDLPGKKFHYSNTGYTILAQIIASVSQMAYEDYIQEYIFNPLNMGRSCFFIDQLDKMSDIATHYYWKDQQEMPPYHEPIIAGCGGVISTVMDQAKYLQMMLNFGQCKGKKLLSSKSIKDMEKAHIDQHMMTGAMGKGLGPEAYGYGWGVFSDFCQIKVMDHPGSTGNASANLFYSHNLNIGIAGVSNSEAGGNIAMLMSFLLSAALRDKNPMEIFPMFALEGVYSNLQGIYTGYKGIIQFQIKYKSGLLYMDELGNDGKPLGMEHILAPVNDNLIPPFHFHAYNGAGARGLYEFTIDEKGSVHISDDRLFIHKIRNL